MGIYKLKALTPTVLQDFINGKAKQNYSRNTHDTRLYFNNKRQLNTTGAGEEIHLIAVRENGEYVIPRSMQHTSSVIHHELNYPRFDFHSLRHTHATMPAENDVPPKYLKQRMGHKNLEVTMKFYLHLTEQMQEKGSDILQRMYQVEKEKSGA